MELDFSKLEKIAYRSFEEAEARAEKDRLIEQGFTIAEGEKTPFDATPVLEADTSIPPPKSLAQRKSNPFAGIDKSRNYRAMYRAACNFHERHNPPTVDSEYWKSRTQGIDDTPQTELDYWEKVAEDISATASAFHQDPFLVGLLIVIFEELEREYREIKERCGLTEKDG